MSDLSAFIETHLGVGSLTSDLWFIGPEPAGSGSRAEIQTRVASFAQQGSPAITNLRADLLTQGEIEYFMGEKPKLQRYWAAIGRIWLAAHGAQTVSTDAVRAFQQHVICGHHSRTSAPLLLETSALPARSTGEWPYTWCDELRELRSRREYEPVIQARLRRIGILIDEHRPRVVLLMGTTYRKRWDVLLKLKPANVHLEVVPHPNSRPTLKNSDWVQLGRGLRERLT